MSGRCWVRQVLGRAGVESCRCLVRLSQELGHAGVEVRQVSGQTVDLLWGRGGGGGGAALLT